MALSEKEMKQLALARLEQKGRSCDGCGCTIGRWTKKCHYDEAHDRVYCSTGGCAQAVIDGGQCDQCEEYLNPFESGVETFPGPSGDRHLCAGCAAGFDPDDLLAGYDVIPVNEVKGLTREQKKWAQEGPYFAVREGEMYKVIRPMPGDSRFVRSSVCFANQAARLASEFNRDESENTE